MIRSKNNFRRFYQWKIKKRMEMWRLNKILLLIQSQVFYFPHFLLLFVNQPFIGFHSTDPPDFFIGLNSLFLKFLNRLLQFDSYSFIAFCELYNSCKTVFGFYSEFAKVIVENVKLRVEGNVSVWYLKLVIFILIERNKSAALSLGFHLFENLNKCFEFLL